MIGCIRATAPYGPAVGNRTRRGIRGAAGRRAEEPPLPGTAKREYGDRELIAASPSRGAPFEEERCGDPVESDGRRLRICSGATAWIAGAAGRRSRESRFWACSLRS